MKRNFFELNLSHGWQSLRARQGNLKDLFRLGLFLSILFISFIPGKSFAKTEALFSPRGMIREAIIAAIKSAERSIDIAVFAFTAGDIAEALADTKERGVRIRIVIDNKQMRKGHPVLRFLEEEGLDIQSLEGNVGGLMHNTFAVFDNRLLVTGSYNWTEYAERFNYENAIFIDDPDVIERFHDEFESIYKKSTKSASVDVEKLPPSSLTTPAIEPTTRTARKEGIIPPPDKTDAIKEGTSVGKGEMSPDLAPRPNIVDEDVKRTRPDVEERQDGSTTADDLSAQRLVNISFEAFDELFGRDSKLEAAEGKRLWKERFEGRYVRWTGKVCYKGISLYDWNKVGISHKGGDADVQLKFDWPKQQEVSGLRIGDTITYTGRLTSLHGLTAPYRLTDGDVEE